jgi:hypothetical protein
MKTHVENTFKRRVERAVKRLFASFGYKIMPLSDLNNERVVEYPWIFRKVGAHQGNFLDAGCSGSDLSSKLASQGLEVYGVDIYRKNLIARGQPNFSFVLCDIRWLPFVDGSFDVVTAVSTLEHIGIGFYGDIEDSEGDTRSVNELRRVTKVTGNLLVTVPFGEWKITNMQRTYDCNTLKRLFGNFKANIDVDYFVRRNDVWHKTDCVEVPVSSTRVNAVACISFTKMET